MDVSVIQNIVSVGKRLYKKQMVNAFEGNLSVLQDGYIYITPTGDNKDLLRENEVCVIEQQSGKQIAGRRKPSSEISLHLFIYRARQDVNAVIHVHSPYLTAFAMCHKEIRSEAHGEVLAFFDVIRLAEYGRAGTEELAENAVKILREDDIALLANHGAVACGADLEAAFNLLESAEQIAHIQTIIGQVGREVPLSAEECTFFRNMYQARKLK